MLNFEWNPNRNDINTINQVVMKVKDEITFTEQDNMNQYFMIKDDIVSIIEETGIEVETLITLEALSRITGTDWMNAFFKISKTKNAR